jgi:hypothetical protein
MWIRAALQPDCRVVLQRNTYQTCFENVEYCIRIDSLDFGDSISVSCPLNSVSLRLLSHDHIPKWLRLHDSTSRTCTMSTDWWLLSQEVRYYHSCNKKIRELTFVIGGSGLGLIIAQALESNGAKVYITGRNEERLQEAVKTAVRPPHRFRKNSIELDLLTRRAGTWQPNRHPRQHNFPLRPPARRRQDHPRNRLHRPPRQQRRPNHFRLFA